MGDDEGGLGETGRRACCLIAVPPLSFLCCVHDSCCQPRACESRDCFHEIICDRAIFALWRYRPEEQVPLLCYCPFLYPLFCSDVFLYFTPILSASSPKSSGRPPHLASLFQVPFGLLFLPQPILSAKCQRSQNLFPFLEEFKSFIGSNVPPRFSRVTTWKTGDMDSRLKVAALMFRECLD